MAASSEARMGYCEPHFWSFGFPENDRTALGHLRAKVHVAPVRLSVPHTFTVDSHEY